MKLGGVGLTCRVAFGSTLWMKGIRARGNRKENKVVVGQGYWEWDSEGAKRGPKGGHRTGDL